MPQNQSYERFSTSWGDFCASRAEYLTALAITVGRGVQQRDTAHPAFCGCIDWHSCVHGVYALLAASRLTGDPQWADLAEGLLAPDKLDAELASLLRGDLDHELPYGFSWFLTLARERERWSGKTDLSLLATEVATRIEQWIFSLSAEQILFHAQNRAYGNLSWAVLNLYEWARFRNDRRLTERLATFTAAHLLPLDSAIPCIWDEDTSEFFPASLHRSRVLIAVLPGEESSAWARTFFRESFQLEPVTIPPTAHAGGLNFSRSWGLWDLWRQTGDTRFRDSFLQHMVTHIDSPRYWRDDYRKYSHWVAQFGIYAIALSVDRP